jgi:2-polyprenyl-3-methyl-5-hydroxy-6-metoxy-1,4-benzoquinol methylase
LADPYWTEARATVFRGALRLLEAEVGKGRILDIGGGVGHFAELALTAGWDAYSVDVSAGAVAAAADRIGASRSLSAMPEELSGTCDAVTLWCVVAHLPDPRTLLAEALLALRPGGRLFLTTPNFRFQIGYAAALTRLGHSIDFAAHDHLFHFTADSLGRTIEAAGFANWRLTFVGVTEACVADPRLARWAVPAKRLWNRGARSVARAGLPYLGSEFQVVGTAP